MDLAQSPSPNDIPTITVSQGGRQVLDATLLGDDGGTLDLTSNEVLGACLPPGAAPFEDGIRNTGSNIGVKLIARDCPGAQLPALQVDGQIKDPATSRVLFVLEPAATLPPGTYEGQIGLFAVDKLIRTWPIFIEVAANLFQPQNNGNIITVAWVRTAIRDSKESALLGEREFSTAEIQQAMRRAIDRFNAVAPFTTEFTLADFTYRDGLLKGVMGCLFETAAAWYRREHLPYQISGGSVDDRNKFKEYQERSDKLLADFDAWASQLKHSLNSMDFWATI